MLLPSFWVNELSSSLGMDSLYTPRSGSRAFVRSAAAYNAAGAGRCGIGSRYATGKYECGQISTAGVYTSDTTDFTDAGADDFPVCTTVNNTGCILSASEKWNLALLQVTTVAAGGAGVYTYSYWNGSAWVEFTPTDTITWTSGTTQGLFFTPRGDWVTGGQTDAAADIAALSLKYAIKIKATTAPGTAPVLGTNWLGLIQRMRRVAATASVEFEIKDPVPVVVGEGDSLTAYWPAANSGNTIFATGDQKL